MEMPPADPRVMARKARIIDGLRALLPPEAVIEDPAASPSHS